MAVEVTEADISEGGRKDPGGCAAARAILREHPDIRAVRVHAKMTYIEHAHHWERLQTPASLRTELVAFDRGGRFLPGCHQLRPLSPAELSRYDKGKAGGGKNLKKKPAAKKMPRVYHITAGIRDRGANI
jgi:hypothetical protein